MRKATVMLLALWLSSGSVGAITIYVPQNYPTIGAAIQAAQSGDSILVGPGIYDQVPFSITNSPNNITLLGNGYSGPSRTIIIGSGTTPQAKVDLIGVEGWEIGRFEMLAANKGISADQCQEIYLHDLYIHDASWVYADGIGLDENDGVLVERCIIKNVPYCGINVYTNGNSNVTIRHNTIIESNEPGIIVLGFAPGLIIENNIVAFGADEGIEFAGTWTGQEILDYNDVYGNAGSEWQGCTPGPHNISADPQFVGGVGAQQFMLQPNSPCIDAGNPASPLDPDGTIADIGCFYFNQNVSPGQLTLDLDPGYPPPIIPMQGGSFSYTAVITCDTSNYALFDAWTELLLPNGYVMGPLFIRPNIFLPAGGSMLRNLDFYVSAWAMPGFYEFRGYLGDSPDSVYASDLFPFLKEGGDGGMSGPRQAYVTLSGWGEAETVYLPDGGTALPERLELSCTPNPFNPNTTLRFGLPTGRQVTLKIYDLSGRIVATLLNRPLEAGLHTAVFNAEHLASGIYLAVIEWGDQRAIQRLMLLK